MPNFISEDQIEQAMVQRLQHLCGYDAMNCYTADPEDLADATGACCAGNPADGGKYPKWSGRRDSNSRPFEPHSNAEPMFTLCLLAFYAFCPCVCVVV